LVVPRSRKRLSSSCRDVSPPPLSRVRPVARAGPLHHSPVSFFVLHDGRVFDAGCADKNVPGGGQPHRSYKLPQWTLIIPFPIAALSSCAVLLTRVFFIILARWASTVLTLMLRRVAISRFRSPDQINSRISCSRFVKASGPFRGRAMKTAECGERDALTQRPVI
jgi:hypothetical protein